MNSKNEILPKLRFPEFRGKYDIDFLNGNLLFESITNRDHNSDLPILAITQDQGAVPREQIDYNITVTDKSLTSYKIVEAGDFIISLRSFQGGIEYSRFKGICSPAYIVLRKKKKEIIDYYYKYFFKTENYIRSLNKDLEGIRDGKMISYNQFSSIKIPFPDFNEQKKIAMCLSSIDELIDAESKKLEILEKHKKGLMQKLFPADGKTMPEWRFPKFQGCEAWKESTISEIASYVDYRGRTPVKSKDGIFLITAKNIKMGYIDYNASKEYISQEQYLTVMSRGKPQIGDVLITTEAPCGNVAQIDKADVALAQRVIKYRGHKDKINNTFLKYVLLSPVFQNELKKNISGGIVSGIKGSVLHKMSVKYPVDLLEQQKIVDCLSGMDIIIKEQSNKVEQLKTHKKGLMQGLFPSLEEASI